MFFLLGITFPIFAQRDSTKKQTIDITSSYKPVLRNAVKVNFSATNLPADTSRTVGPYKVPPQNLFYTYQPVSLKPLALSQDSSLDLGIRNFIKVGFGNYTMPFFEASFGSLRSRAYEAGGFARYHASFAKLDGRPFGFTDAGIDVFGKKFLKAHTLSAKLSYDHDENYFYGYNQEDTSFAKNDIRQQFHHVGVGIDLATIQDGSKLKVINQAGINYSYTTGDRASSMGKVLFCGVYQAREHVDAELSSNGDFLEATPFLEALIESVLDEAFIAALYGDG